MGCVDLEFRKLADLRTWGFFQNRGDFFYLGIFFTTVGQAQIPIPTYARHHPPTPRAGYLLEPPIRQLKVYVPLVHASRAFIGAFIGQCVG